MRPAHVEFHQIGNFVGVVAREEFEERSDLLRAGLEEDRRLARRFLPSAPPVARADRKRVRARGQASSDRAAHEAVPGGTRGERRVDDPHRFRRAAHPAPRERARATPHSPHAAEAAAVVARGCEPEKSSVASDKSRRSATATRAGTGEMLRIRWYSVSACQVEAFRSSTSR
jgi:hypothetical protein